MGLEARLRDRKKEYIIAHLRKEIEFTLDDTFKDEKNKFYEFTLKYVDSRIRHYNQRKQLLQGLLNLYRDVYYPFVSLDLMLNQSDFIADDQYNVIFGRRNILAAEWHNIQEIISFDEVASYQELLECSKIESPYQIVCKLGEGKSGTTYKVYSPELKKHFALKIINNKFNAKEAELMAKLRGEDLDNIVQIHDAGNHIAEVNREGKYAIVMEYLAGTNLAEYIRITKRFHAPLFISSKKGGFYTIAYFESEIDSYVRIAVQLLNGIISLRRLKITHRDLNPKNIMVSEQLVVKILDFGIATDKKNPEQIDGRRYGTPEDKPADDLFSYGLLMYELFMKKHLVFEKKENISSTMHAERIYELKQKMFKGEIIKNKYLERIPFEIKDFILACLYTQPIDIIKKELIQLSPTMEYFFMTKNQLILELRGRDYELFRLHGRITTKEETES